MKQHRMRLLPGVLLLLLLCFAYAAAAPGSAKRGRAWVPPLPQSLPEKSLPTLDRQPGGRFSYGDETYVPISGFSLPGTFGSLGEGVFTVAESQERHALSCFLLSEGRAIYRFPDSYLNGVHPHLVNGELSRYEGVFYQDVNGDGREDLVVLTYGSLGNFPQLVNLVTVFLQEEDGFSLSEEIAQAALQEQLERSGRDEVVPYGLISYTTLNDVRAYYETSGSP